MPTYKTYSERKREAERSESDVYQYEKIPRPLRKQVKRILKQVIHKDEESYFIEDIEYEGSYFWSILRDRVALSLGRDCLAEIYDEGIDYSGINTSDLMDDPLRDCEIFLDAEQSVDNWLDLVELGARIIGETPLAGGEEALENLNYYFQLEGFGYQYESGQIIRVDSQFIHAEVVKPALHLLSDQHFKGAEEEFLTAHSCYRSGDYKDCIANAGKAFESTLKIIGGLKQWEYDPNGGASHLVTNIFKKNLLPKLSLRWEKSFHLLPQMLTSGLPQVRNKRGGHGQGAEVEEPPPYLAAYALHLAAVNIRLLVEAFNSNADPDDF